MPLQICVDYCRLSELTGYETASVNHTAWLSWSFLVGWVLVCGTNVCARVMQRDYTHALHLAHPQKQQTYLVHNHWALLSAPGPGIES